ncbi:hypothetical protein [Micromonospora sp. NPDC049359]|uniref:hypothetical protein n=1 Tax=Micromonospora sp. NPDC049359 TaxID=3364270 RepID=UPI0037BD7FF3
MTGRRAARDHDERPTGPTVDDEPGRASEASRGGAVAPQPRPVPAADPAAAPRPDPAPSPVPQPGAAPSPVPQPGAAPSPAPRAGAGSRPSPTPRPPTPTPARPSPTAPTPSPARPHPPGPAAERPPAGSSAERPPAGPAAETAAAGSATPAAVELGQAATAELEPTTGAPVDAVPRRVPVRQQSRGRDAYRSDGTEPPDDGGAFWAPIEEVHWDGTPVREDPAPGPRTPATGRRATARTAVPPDPLVGLTVLVLLSLVTAFFAWVSAGPFWLAVGHARDGTVVIDSCAGGGLTQRCRGIFTADGGRFLAHGVRVSGVPAGGGAPGTAHRARMTGPAGSTAYADTGASRHLRWLPGLVVVLGCAAGIVRWTGSARLPGRRHRRWAVAAALAGPTLITLGFLAAAW